MKYREHRYPCDRPVTVRSGELSRPALVVNVSTHGARLARIDGLRAGERVALHLQGAPHPLAADVRWTRGSLAGVRFAAPLDARTIANLRRSVAHRGPVAKSGAWNLSLREMR
ncbi:MAG: hypothetical protein Kow0013_07720 [Pararhodobacter sp.]